jgi:redox-sensitive bicupin YhaK (pirin superfamily)
LKELGARVLVGSASGKQCPVATLTPTLYLDLDLAAGGSLTFEAYPLEFGVYSVNPDLQIDGEVVAAHTLTMLQPNQVTKISARNGARLVVVGGQALNG